MAFLPDFSDATFTPGAAINNPYFPLVPGTVSAFSGETADGETSESNDFFVTSLTNEVMGVQTFVIRDTAYEDGLLVEETLDFYAQDAGGNVWYFGEKVINYEYDDNGKFIGTNDDGAWLAGVDGALPGWIMPADPTVGFSFFNEFAPDVAMDETLILGKNVRIETDLGRFSTLKTQDSSELDPGIIEFKYYARGKGLVRVDEELDAAGNPGLIIELRDVVSVGESKPPKGAEVIDNEDFLSDGSEQWITFIADASELDCALGFYTFDPETGAIGEGFILFDSSDELAPGEAISIQIPEGDGVGLFLVPNASELGLDLSKYEDGGLFFTNMLTGDGALLSDMMAPIVTNAKGDPLPISAFHALGAADGSNLLNPGLGLQAVEWESPKEDDDAFILVGFEDTRATGEDYDGDFDDLLFVLADSPVDPADFATASASLTASGAHIGPSLDSVDGPFELGVGSHDYLV